MKLIPTTTAAIERHTCPTCSATMRITGRTRLDVVYRCTGCGTRLLVPIAKYNDIVRAP